MSATTVSLQEQPRGTFSRWLLAAALAAMLPLAADAAGWRNHAQPYTFLFGNHFDTHQQTFLQKNGNLMGFFYIKFTGAVTTEGLRVARHVDCGAEPGCTAGWQLNGRPAMAKFLYHAMPDHPVWLVARHMIPQPGAYTHFHWLGAHPVPPDDVMRDGYLLELRALDTFCFVHGDPAAESGNCADFGGLRVVPGIDTSTHTNIVTSVEGDGGGH